MLKDEGLQYVQLHCKADRDDKDPSQLLGLENVTRHSGQTNQTYRLRIE